MHMWSIYLQIWKPCFKCDNRFDNENGSFAEELYFQFFEIVNDKKEISGLQILHILHT